MSGCVARWHLSRCILDRVHSGPHMLAGGVEFPTEGESPKLLCRDYHQGTMCVMPTGHEGAHRSRLASHIPGPETIMWTNKSHIQQSNNLQPPTSVEPAPTRAQLQNMQIAKEHELLIKARDLLAHSIEQNLRTKVGLLQLMYSYDRDQDSGVTVDVSDKASILTSRILHNFSLDLANNAVQGIAGLLLPG